MRWNCIGRSVVGTSHMSSGRACDDVVHYKTIATIQPNDTLIVCVCDGAGSAEYGAVAAETVANRMVALLSEQITGGTPLTEGLIHSAAVTVYHELVTIAHESETDITEYACTLLGAVLLPDFAAFFQIGDGAIVRQDTGGDYLPVWWPDNGEYLNTTNFLIDDPELTNLRIAISDSRQTQIAIFTDGLQMLALNNELRTGHTPFFAGLFPSVLAADTPDKEAVLNHKLAEYLQSEIINERTDDDKTLFLAAYCPR
ncbi:MAG: protein phosphatase 2C domain-containing protein [Chitinophagaceae bacterium]|nr:protein phosphatase 2C domain-containing protein [Chitinophagaceae bacterium]